jgi:hypothetical protein
MSFNSRARNNTDTPTKQVTAKDLSGLELFFGNFERANVHLPGFSFYSRADSGLKDVYISHDPNEQSLFWSTIQSPPVDPSIINLRQALIMNLCADIKDTKSIHSDIGRGPILENNLEILFTIPTSEYHVTDRERRCNLEILIHEHGVNAENITSKLTELKELPASSYHWDHNGPTPVSIIERLRDLESLMQLFIAAIKKIDNFEDPNLKAISASLLASAETLGEMTPARIMSVAKNEDQRADLLRRVADFNAQLDMFGMLCAFADLAQRDEYCLCTFDESKDDLYQEAWNMLREKNGHKVGFGVDDVTPQVSGDSPSSKQHIVICGLNRAGKSFCSDRDLSLRLVAQSFGLAPAKQANIHIADSFIRVDRTSPAASDVVINGVKKEPSDFAREVLVRKDAYPKIGARCQWYSDESWTTTSPHYEYRLNVAEAIFLKSKNVRLFTITHNTEALKYWSKQTDISIHHFEVDESDPKNPKSTRTLIDGIDTSRSFEGALGLGIAPEFIEFGRGYLKGEYTVERPGERNIEVREHTAAERELLKQSARSLRSLVPQSDELVGGSDRSGRIFIRWRSIVDRLRRHPDEDDHSSPLPIGSSLWKQQYRFPFWAISNNNDHFLIHSRVFPFARSPEFFENGSIDGFIKHGATNDPKELIERTKLFKELSKEGVLEKLNDNLNELNKALMHVTNTGLFTLDNYPQALLNAIDLSIKQLEKDPDSWDLKALALVRQSLKLIRHHCKIPDNDNIFDSWLNKLEKIEPLEIARGVCLSKQEETAAEGYSDLLLSLIRQKTEIDKEIKGILTGDEHLRGCPNSR